MSESPAGPQRPSERDLQRPSSGSSLPQHPVLLSALLLVVLFAGLGTLLLITALPVGQTSTSNAVLSGPALEDKVRSLLAAESAAEALRLVDRALGDQPNDPRLLAWRGTCLAHLGQPLVAVDTFARIDQAASGLPDEALLAAAGALRRLHLHQRALVYLDEAVRRGLSGGAMPPADTAAAIRRQGDQPMSLATLNYYRYQGISVQAGGMPGAASEHMGEWLMLAGRCEDLPQVERDQGAVELGSLLLSLNRPLAAWQVVEGLDGRAADCRAALTQALILHQLGRGQEGVTIVRAAIEHCRDERVRARLQRLLDLSGAQR